MLIYIGLKIGLWESLKNMFSVVTDAVVSRGRRDTVPHARLHMLGDARIDLSIVSNNENFSLAQPRYAVRLKNSSK